MLFLILSIVICSNLALPKHIKSTGKNSVAPSYNADFWLTSDGEEPASDIDEYDVADNYDDEYIEEVSSIEADTNGNSMKQINMTGELHFTHALSNVSRETGQSAKLHCEVIGTPLPKSIIWYKNYVPIARKHQDRTRIKQIRKNSTNAIKSQLRIINLEVHDTGFYKCVASNHLLSIESTGVLYVKPNTWDQDKVQSPDLSYIQPPVQDFPEVFKVTSTGFLDQSSSNSGNIDSTNIMSIPEHGQTYPFSRCELYIGSICSEFLSKKKVYIPSNMSQLMIETKLSNAFKVISLSNDLSKSCGMYVLPSLCYSSLPLCKRIDIPIPEFICREDCELLENEICRVEYAIAKRHNLIGQVISLSDCTTLPSSECRHLGLPTPEPPNPNEECYWGDGTTYRGTASETESGKHCMQWSHQLNIKTADYPVLLGGHRFCRNPAARLSQPWCFTSQGTSEHCKIPECDDFKIHIIVAIFGIIVLIATGIYCSCATSRRKRAKRDAISAGLKQSGRSSIVKINIGSASAGVNSRLEMSSLIPSSTISSQKSSEDSNIKVTQYNLSNIKFHEELGEGAFGKVYKGEINVPGQPVLMVAIKTLKENANSKTVAEFKREVDLMSELHHPNIICLLGVCFSNRLCMLFEFMTHGDLHEFLISHSPTCEIAQNDNPPLDSNDLLNISIQIVAGMAYLCNQHFVHRDLATRNCLVGDNLTVKISDFGLSRDIYSSDYYRVQKSALLPIRWMSPESILYGKFTVESDIWSYGVVLWEIYSYGLQPYFAHNNQDVVDMIRSHQILPCPDECPSRMYALMIECWNQIPSRRPTFTEIHARLLQMSNPNYSRLQSFYHMPMAIHR